jgi:hypothetical protein
MRAKLDTATVPTNLASLIRGLYKKVAIRLHVHPSYVSRVARGERQSTPIRSALKQELHKIIKRFDKAASGRTRKVPGRKGRARRKAQAN